MNVRRTIFIVILLVLIATRHYLLSDETKKTGFNSLVSTISSLSDLHLKIESHMKQLIVAEMKAPPDQDYLIMMVVDKLEMIKMICVYNQRMLETIVDGGVTAAYRKTYIGQVKENLIFEIARIKGNMGRIESIYPMIKDKKVSKILKEFQQIGQGLIRLFEDTEKRLSREKLGSHLKY